MRDVYQQLIALKNHAGYKKLFELWMQKATDIESRRDIAASRGQESAWRYFAGLEKGFKQAMTQLDETLLAMEEEGGEIAQEPSETIERLLKEARGDMK